MLETVTIELQNGRKVPVRIRNMSLEERPREQTDEGRTYHTVTVDARIKYDGDDVTAALINDLHKAFRDRGRIEIEVPYGDGSKVRIALVSFDQPTSKEIVFNYDPNAQQSF